MTGLGSRFCCYQLRSCGMPTGLNRVPTKPSMTGLERQTLGVLVEMSVALWHIGLLRGFSI